MSELKNWRRHLDRLLMEQQTAAHRVREETEILTQTKRCEQDAAEAQKRAQEVAEQVQVSAHEQIATVVSQCLQLVYGDRFQFKIVFEQKRGKTEARFVFMRSGHELDPMLEGAGGAIDVAAFGAQLTNLMLSRPRRRRFLCLDEPFLNLHGKKWRQRLRALVEGISANMGVQMLLLTQDDSDLRIGTVIDL